MPVEKLAPIVGIKTQDRKGQRRLDLGDALCHVILAAIEHRAGLRPLRIHIGRCQTPAKISGHTLPAVRHCVGLDKSWSAHIPMLGANGNLFAQKGPGARPAASAPSLARPAGCQQPVNARRTYSEQFLPQALSQAPSALLVVGQPHLQRRLQALAAGLFGRQPDRFDDLTFRDPVNSLRTSALAPATTHDRSLAAQHLDGILALISA
jgi:hypothetical protein